MVVIALGNQNLRTDHGKTASNSSFFLFEDVSLDIFQGLSELEKKIEPQDLMDDVYRAFDSVGNILNFRIVEKEQKGFWVSTKIKTVVFDSADMPSDDLF